MSAHDPQLPQQGDEFGPDTRSLFERFKDFVLDEAPSWLASMVIHMIVLLLIALFFGRAMVDEMVGDAPVFEASRRADGGEEPEIERFNIGDAPVDPTELNTESLMLKDPPGQAQQEAMYYDDSKTFEDQGGGTPLGLASGAGGMGFNITAEGLGPVLHGAGGADQGKGDGTGFGKGGAGEGFGARGQGSREALLGRYGGTKQTERAVAGALNWLARHQNLDGSWSVHNKFQKRCKDQSCTGPGNTDADAGGTALGLLPFLAAGQTHRSSGPYKRQIAKAISWFTSRQKPNGDLSAGTAHQMYSHGLAAIAMCEAYGMTGDNHVGRAARLAVEFIQKAQNAQGGWRYVPNTNDGDTSVLGWQMMALKSATMAGISVDPKKLELGRMWLDTVSEGKRDPSLLGQFTYQRGTPPTPPMSAVALLILQYMGADRSEPVMVGGLKYLTANPPSIEDRDTYYWYYATQVFHNVSGPEWDAWNRQMRRILVETQVKTGCAAGSWDPDRPTGDRWGPLGGRLMLTSLSALTLEIYYRYLPLYKLDTEPDAKDKPPPAAKGGTPVAEAKKKDAPKDKKTAAKDE